MLYFTPPSTQPVRDAITRGELGAIDVPDQGNKRQSHWTWFADNRCFGQYPGDEKWSRWLASRPHQDRCLFAVVPDVVCDAKGTLDRATRLLPVVQSAGYRVAFALQNGVTPGMVPWDDIDVVFIGGDDAFKASSASRRVVDEALSRGKTAHWGRANGLGRLATANSMGCATADGKTLVMYPPTFGPMMRWLRYNRVQQGVLW